MTNRKLAKIILDYIPYWELPHTETIKNYKMILLSIKKEPQDIYDYINDEYVMSDTKDLIMKELKRRIK